MFTFLTLAMIVVPSVLCVYFTILQADDKIIDQITKISILCLYILSFTMCILMLYYTSFTDPGILPSVYQNSGIPNTESLVPNTEREYFCEYQHKIDLIHTLADMHIDGEAEKFYSPLKFHYLPLTLQQNRWGNEHIIDEKKRHNRLSYCKTC